ncbi:hypothetical protein Pint_11655 [Pistacia integerrima]|uniref:Uncharacterized protein n=1 Tax=Pistacia integerrima TaxID=434235 RepID=A0ACC0XLM2_9ROSI|nr:hypothetical protein Pint_11655 [Pistacia integerrima]
MSSSSTQNLAQLP